MTSACSTSRFVSGEPSRPIPHTCQGPGFWIAPLPPKVSARAASFHDAANDALATAEVKSNVCGARDQGDVWAIKKPQKNDLHPTMKPVELVERAIRNSSRPGNVVLDPFGGSGTTLIAAEKSGRVARLIELDPKYVDVIVRRWEDFTGQTAIREAADQELCAS